MNNTPDNITDAEQHLSAEIEMETGEGKIDKNKLARKPFIVDMDKNKDKEMAVFTHAKKLSEYVFVITEKSPKKLRWSMVSRLQNCSTDVVENLYRANMEKQEMRAEFQKKALVSLQLLDFYAETAKRMQAINLHQMEVIAKHILETKKLLLGWARATKEKNK